MYSAFSRGCTQNLRAEKPQGNAHYGVVSGLVKTLIEQLAALWLVL